MPDPTELTDLLTLVASARADRSDEATRDNLASAASCICDAILAEADTTADEHRRNIKKKPDRINGETFPDAFDKHIEAASATLQRLGYAGEATTPAPKPDDDDNPDAPEFARGINYYHFSAAS